MKVTHKIDYAVRATVLIAGLEVAEPGVPVPSEAIAARLDIPVSTLQVVLRQLGNHQVLRSTRGPDGGWSLGRPAAEVTVAQVIRAVDGPLASVRGIRPHELAGHGDEEPFISLWVAVRAALRSVLDHVTVADLVAGELPSAVAAMVEDPNAWEVH